MEKANEVHVMMAIVSGELPARPENAGIDELWSICERCWQRKCHIGRCVDWSTQSMVSEDATPGNKDEAR